MLCQISTLQFSINLSPKDQISATYNFHARKTTVYRANKPPGTQALFICHMWSLSGYRPRDRSIRNRRMRTDKYWTRRLAHNNRKTSKCLCQMVSGPSVVQARNSPPDWTDLALQWMHSRDNGNYRMRTETNGMKSLLSVWSILMLSDKVWQ